MKPGCRVQDQLNISEPTVPYIIGRELNLRKLPGRQWESNSKPSEQLRPMTIKTSASTKTATTACIIMHLRDLKLIKSSQNGFVRNRSRLTNLHKFVEYVCNYMDKGLPVDVIYLHFRKAFDKVPHKRLMVKVKAHGIGGKIWGWIDDWLNGRRQQLTLNGRESNWIDVLSEVLHGSVLRLILFVVYINDIDSYVSSKILKFADDTKFVGVVSSPEGLKKFRQDLVDLDRWSNEWLMLFNTDKCKVI